MAREREQRIRYELRQPLSGLETNSRGDAARELLLILLLRNGLGACSSDTNMIHVHINEFISNMYENDVNIAAVMRKLREERFWSWTLECALHEWIRVEAKRSECNR